MLSVSEVASLPRPFLRADVHGGGVAAGGGVEGVAAGAWGGVLAAVWVIWSREGKKRYVKSPSTTGQMPDLGAPEVVVLAIRNSKARPTIVRRFRKSRRSPFPSLAANSTATRPTSLLVLSPGTALS